MPLSIQASTTKNCVAANSEIGSQELFRCRFRNRQPKTMSLPIQKSTAMVESFQLYFSFFVFFFGVYNNSAYSSILFSHNSSLMHAKSIHYHEHEFLPQLMHVSMS